MHIIQLGQKDDRPTNEDKVLIELDTFSELIRDDSMIESIIRDLRYIRNQTSQED
jgi:hypothetical protein